MNSSGGLRTKSDAVSLLLIMRVLVCELVDLDRLNRVLDG